MKLSLNISLFLFAFVIVGDKSFALTDYQIKKICRKEKKVSICIKNLQNKRYNLQKGNLIEIPVKTYNSN